MSGEVYQGIVEKIIAQGYGLVRSPVGVVFCPPGTSVPRDHIQFQVQKESKNRLLATNITIIEPSPSRVNPQCTYFDHCGGCDLMHVSYDHQLEIKQSILLESLTRQGIDPKQIPPIQIWKSKEFGYRNRIQLQVDGERSGFYAQGSHKLISIESCLITASELQQVFHLSLPPGTYQALGPNNHGKISVVHLTKNLPGSRASNKVPGFSNTLEITFPNLILDSPSGGFFQSNFLGLIELRNRIFDYAQELSDSLGPSKRAVELYCGQGILGQALPPSFTSILGVDRDDTPHCYGPRGKKKVQSVEIFCNQNRISTKNTFDLLIADPSRKGFGKPIFPWIKQQKIPNLFLVFCDPVSAARDLGIGLSLGYKLKRLELLDFYPQTHQFETFCWLELDNG